MKTTNIEIIKNILKLQDKLNSQINPKWKEAKLDWHTAILVETAELIDSLAWKWWKHQEIDWDNVKVELVDIFHFIISLAIESEARVKLFLDSFTNESQRWDNSTIHLLFKENDFNEQNKKSIMINYAHELVKTTSEKRTEQDMKRFTFKMFSLWADMWALAGYTFEDIAKEYLIKNTLNTFRQDYGYKTGEYHKIWVFPDDTMQEDNEVAYDIAKQLPLDTNFSDKLYKELKSIYERLLNER